jgi:hypothetical protein
MNTVDLLNIEEILNTIEVLNTVEKLKIMMLEMICIYCYPGIDPVP